jgi:hypothetical protein
VPASGPGIGLPVANAACARFSKTMWLSSVRTSHSHSRRQPPPWNSRTLCKRLSQQTSIIPRHKGRRFTPRIGHQQIAAVSHGCYQHGLRRGTLGLMLCSMPGAACWLLWLLHWSVPVPGRPLCVPTSARRLSSCCTPTTPLVPWSYASLAGTQDRGESIPQQRAVRGMGNRPVLRPALEWRSAHDPPVRTPTARRGSSSAWPWGLDHTVPAAAVTTYPAQS